jgi:hypothetical protein
VLVKYIIGHYFYILGTKIRIKLKKNKKVCNFSTTGDV